MYIGPIHVVTDIHIGLGLRMKHMVNSAIRGAYIHS